MSAPFELLLFVASAEVAAAAAEAGINGVVVDWECRGKHDRQAGFDTQINQQTIRDLRSVRNATDIGVICRINGYGPWTSEEVESAISEGADEILLPMARHPDEAERTIALAAGRCKVGILIETVRAVQDVRAFARLPVARAYVGLNDLAIDRGTENLFAALTDGTVEDVRRPFMAPFGFGGLTVPDRGSPVPCALLIAEMVRLRCGFSFLRRSFLRDVPIDEFPSGVRRIRAAIAAAGQRSCTDVALARQTLTHAVAAWT